MELVLGGKVERIVLYSPEDHERISKYTWSPTQKGKYCDAPLEDGRKVQMHRFIMGEPEDKIVDHVNGIGLDNRRENLRVTDKEGNSQNKRKQTGTTSKYMGVYLHKTGKWCSRIKIKGKELHVGTFEIEIDAARARDAYIVQNYPESLFNLNFPEDRETYITYVLKTIKKRSTNKPKPKKIKTLYEDIEGKPDIIRLLIDNAPDAFVTIDREDYDKIKYTKYIDSLGYIVASGGSNRCLNRLLMNETNPKFVIDHIDRNPYNNTKKNLRRITQPQNAQNRSKNKNPTTSKYVGVYFVTAKQKWRSRIKYNNKTKHIGYFKTEYEAALARDFYIIRDLPGTFYPLAVLRLVPVNPTVNFIERIP